MASSVEEEDDFMSDKFLQYAQQVDEQMRQEDIKKKRGRPTTQNNMKSVRAQEAENREAGLAKPIGSESKGFKMLMAMGYKPGQSIGLREGGITEPIPIDRIKQDKIGLGAESPEVTKKREREEMERITASKRMKLESEFKMAARDNYEAKKISYRLAEAVRVCRHLDETKSIQENELLAEFDNAEKREEPLTIAKYISQELSPDDRAKKLLALLEYLRNTHFYCIYCGSVFKDLNDLEANCPGPLEQDHD